MPVCCSPSAPSWGAFKTPNFSRAWRHFRRLQDPSFALTGITWNQLFVGVVLLALPQNPLTLGNAVIAITDENNRLFPRSAVTEARLRFPRAS